MSLQAWLAPRVALMFVAGTCSPLSFAHSLSGLASFSSQDGHPGDIGGQAAASLALFCLRVSFLRRL
jgi:hypothetical protein